jgi:hypothetical protein
LSYQQVKTLTGIDEMTVLNWEHLHTVPHPKNFMKLICAYQKLASLEPVILKEIKSLVEEFGQPRLPVDILDPVTVGIRLNRSHWAIRKWRCQQAKKGIYIGKLYSIGYKGKHKVLGFTEDEIDTLRKLLR